MKRFIAFLRGINISGKNKVPMAQLKTCFEGLGFNDVKTYLNSGNVAFSTDEEDITALIETIEEAIKNQFSFDIPVFVISTERLEIILSNAPLWWDDGNKENYHNLIFIMPPATFSEVYAEIGEPKEEYEKIKNYDDAVFWTFSLKNYRKTNWWSKTASVEISKKLTIRTANTVKKIVKL